MCYNTSRLCDTDSIKSAIVVMKIFFLQFRVVPHNINENFELVDGALASCWIKDDNQQSAYIKAEFYVSKYDWDIVSIESLPIEVSKEDFVERDIGQEQFCKAQEEGIAIVYTGLAKDGKTIAGPIKINSSYKFSLFDYINKALRFSVWKVMLGIEAS